ncbi:MAG: hypothetical protein WC705_02420 [Candidatus Paceibacterota bacterium]|jgi:hypothetical protein
MIKKFVLVSLSFLFINVFFINSFVLAAVATPPTREEIINPFGSDPKLRSPITGLNSVSAQPGGSWSAKQVVFGIIRWIYTIFFIVAVLFILLSAYNFIQGGSNDAKVKIARAQLKYAVIAIVVAILGAGIPIIIDNFLRSGGNY